MLNSKNTSFVNKEKYSKSTKKPSKKKGKK